MKTNKISKFAHMVAGIIIMLLVSAMFVVSYVFLGLWFVVIPTILGAMFGSKRYDEVSKEGFTNEDIVKLYQDFDKATDGNKTIH
tara:strand:- start:1201 stop:1455 length:255 start_codon:yes stop_codon:yes gene_type:complete